MLLRQVIMKEETAKCMVPGLTNNGNGDIIKIENYTFLK